MVGIRDCTSSLPGYRSCKMEHRVHRPHFPPLILGGHPNSYDCEDDVADECRNLIRVLSFTIDSLCSEGVASEKKLRHIRALISSLSTMNALSDENDPGTHRQEYIEDVNGTRYFSVRNCELERFSAK